MRKNSEPDERLRPADFNIVEKLAQEKQNAFKRFPLLFAVLVILGTATAFNGITRLVSKVPLLYNNPLITLVTGLLILLFTGTLYKKL